jgi:hypothetical protein
MALQCKINYDQNGQIDYIETDNGQRSKLFDDLVKLFGGDKNLALDYYALTEDKEFQAVYGKDEVRFSIAGERGIANLTDKTEAERRLKDLSLAVEMDNLGVKPLEIKQKTGWEKNKADGKWRFEIPDGELKRTSFRKNKEYNLSEVLDSELSEMYPNIKVKIVDNADRTIGGGFNPTTNTIEINSNFSEYQGYEGGNTFTLPERLQGELFRAILHEATHATQSVEGFGRGGSPQGMAMEARAVVGLKETDDRTTAIEKANKVINGQGYSKLDKELATALKETLEGSISEDPFQKLYERISGEVEAKTVEYRSGLLLENLRDSLMSRDFNISEEDQIFLSNSLGISAISSPQKINQELIDKLKQNGLSEDVFLMSTQEIDAKLKELGVSDDVRKQVADYVKGYYSNANVAFSNLKDKNVKNVQGWMKALTDVQKNGGIKNVNQELEWIGFEDYLNEYVKENNPKAGNIPSSVVEDYIKSNQIEIVDVSKEEDSDTYIVLNEDGENVSGEYYSKKEAEEYVRIENEAGGNYSMELYEYGKGETKYSGYQLKGGENYREVLLTMPNSNLNSSIEEYKKTLREQSELEKKLGLDTPTEEQRIEYERLSSKLADLKYNFGDKVSIGNHGIPQIKEEYKSSHWDEANILAHVRLNEKTLPDGRRVLIVNEIQSDWAQQGRKDGFKRTKQAQDELITEHRKVLQELEELDAQIVDAVENKKSNILELGEKKAELIKKSDELRNDIFKPRAPQMPYKNTDQWVGLVTRRVMQMASQEGYDGVALATGQQSADMYSLSQQVDKIIITPTSEKDKINKLRNEAQKKGNFELVDYYDEQLIKSKNENIKVVYISMKNNADDTVFINQEGIITESASGAYNGKQAEEVLGKDLTRKILETTEDTTLEGEGLEFGGEGMKTFYDKIVPKVVQKEAQRFDKNAKLEAVDFESVVKSEDKLSLGVQPYLPLTKSIKDSVSQGVPQFQKALNQVGIDMIVNGFVYKNQVFLNKDVASNETAIHEFSHLFNSWLKENKKELYNKSIDLIKAELEKENSDISDIISYVRTTQPDLKGEAFYEELLTELTGRRGAELLNSKKKSGIIDWLKEFWNEIKDMLGLLEATPEQVSKMTLKDFADASAVQLLKGQNIKEYENKQLSPREEQRENKAGRVATEATNFLRAKGRTNQKNSSVKDVVNYAQADGKELTTQEKIELQDTIMSLGVNSSYQAEEMLRQALVTEGLISFNRNKMIDSGAFNSYEVSMILNSAEKQQKLRDVYQALKNTEEIVVEYDKNFVNKKAELNSFGKQVVLNPFILEEQILDTLEVPEGVEYEIPEGLRQAKLLDVNGNQKTEGTDTKDILELSYIDDYNETMAENIDFITNGFSPNVWESKKDAVAKIVKQIKKDAVNNGIDLKDIEAKVYSKSRAEIINFFNTLEDFLETGDATVFAEAYNEMFDLNKPLTQTIYSDNNADVVINEPISEYKAFTELNLVKKSPTVYRKVKSLPLEQMYEIVATNKKKSVEEVQLEVRNSLTDVSDFEVDMESLEKITLWKDYFNFPKNSPELVVEKQDAEEVKKMNKKILKSNNPYLKTTKNGIEYVNEDPLTISRAEMTLPRKKADIAPIIEEDLLKAKRERALTNPKSINKLNSDYVYLQDNLVAVKNTSEDFIRTPRGIFEIVGKEGNLTFFQKVESLEKPMTEVNLESFNYLQTKPEVFMQAKKYYTKAELEKINKENFSCN